MFQNEVLLHYYNGMMVPNKQKPEDENNTVMFAAGTLNLLSLGFVPSTDLAKKVIELPQADMIAFFQEAVGIIRQTLGADDMHEPMYPNFPNEVVNITDTELYLNAAIHYITGGKWVPQYEKEERPELREDGVVKLLNLCKEDMYHDVFHKMMRSEYPLSPEDTMYLITYLSMEKNPCIPDEIPVKEICALVERTLMQNRKYHVVRNMVKTPTDILRLALVLSDGDYTLRDNCRMKFGPFRREIRHFLLQLLNDRKSPLEEMQAKRNLWIRLGEVLHPGEKQMRTLYPYAAKAFDDLRNKNFVRTFEGKLEAAYAARNLADVVSLLESKPGVFARHMDRVLRMAGTKEEQMLVFSRFHAVAREVSPRVLLQMLQFFLNRNDAALRMFKPATAEPTFYIKKNTLEKLDEEVIRRAIAICRSAIAAQLASQDYLGAVYIDPELRHIAMPMYQRAMPKGFRLLPTGSRMKLNPDTNVVRAFIHWENECLKHSGDEIRTDIDLSVVLMDEECNVITDVSYYNLIGHNPNTKKVIARHSGDFIDAPIDKGGASEFIDIRLGEQCEGVRYAVVSVNAYTQTLFENLGVCYGGWMEREDMESGEVFEPKTVASKFNMMGERVNTPFIIDLQEREVIWVNGNFNLSDRCPMCVNNAKTTRELISSVVETIVGTKYVSAYEIAELHAAMRGVLVEDKDEADTVFSVDCLPV